MSTITDNTIYLDVSPFLSNSFQDKPNLHVGDHFLTKTAGPACYNCITTCPVKCCEYTSMCCEGCYDVYSQCLRQIW